MKNTNMNNGLLTQTSYKCPGVLPSRKYPYVSNNLLPKPIFSWNALICSPLIGSKQLFLNRCIAGTYYSVSKTFVIVTILVAKLLILRFVDRQLPKVENPCFKTLSCSNNCGTMNLRNGHIQKWNQRLNFRPIVSAPTSLSLSAFNFWVPTKVSLYWCSYHPYSFRPSYPTTEEIWR